jgi:hypothetical protein
VFSRHNTVLLFFFFFKEKKLSPQDMSHGKTALKICSAAAVVATAWICGGMTLHSYVMESANEQERQLATDLKWDNTKLPLHSLDKSDPNNKKWSMQQQQQQQQQQQKN